LGAHRPATYRGLATQPSVRAARPSVHTRPVVYSLRCVTAARSFPLLLAPRLPPTAMLPLAVTIVLGAVYISIGSFFAFASPTFEVAQAIVQVRPTRPYGRTAQSGGDAAWIFQRRIGDTQVTTQGRPPPPPPPPAPPRLQVLGPLFFLFGAFLLAAPPPAAAAAAAIGEGRSVPCFASPARPLPTPLTPEPAGGMWSPPSQMAPGAKWFTCVPIQAARRYGRVAATRPQRRTAAKPPVSWHAHARPSQPASCIPPLCAAQVHRPHHVRLPRGDPAPLLVLLRRGLPRGARAHAGRRRLRA
jgi:hypothetical protein